MGKIKREIIEIKCAVAYYIFVKCFQSFMSKGD
jgi:hypothetical protein